MAAGRVRRDGPAMMGRFVAWLRGSITLPRWQLLIGDATLLLLLAAALVRP
jgi:hypothetical protein